MALRRPISWSETYPAHKNSEFCELQTSWSDSMTASLCASCNLMREIATPKGSRFLLCQLSQTNPRFRKYPPQPVVRCTGYQPKPTSMSP